MALTKALEEQKILSKAEIEQILNPTKKTRKKVKAVKTKKPATVVADDKVEGNLETINELDDVKSNEFAILAKSKQPG